MRAAAAILGALVVAVGLAGCSSGNGAQTSGPSQKPSAAASTPFDCSKAQDQGEWMEHHCDTAAPEGPKTYAPSTTATWKFASEENCTGNFKLASMDDQTWLQSLDKQLKKDDPKHEWVPVQMDLDNTKGTTDCAPMSVTVVAPGGDQLETADPGDQLSSDTNAGVDAYNSLIDNAIELKPGAKGSGYLFFQDEPPAWSIAYVSVGTAEVAAEQI